MSDPRVAQRDQHQCQWCGVALGYDRSCHHRQFKSRGGGDGPENRVMLCGSGTTGCHRRCHNRDPDDEELATALGYVIPSWADPATVPMWSATWQLWILVDSDYFWVPWTGPAPCPPPKPSSSPARRGSWR